MIVFELLLCESLQSSTPALLKVPSCISSGSIRLHASNPNLSTAALANDKADTESVDSTFDVAKLHEDFFRVATNRESNIVSFQFDVILIYHVEF